jgi:hypothetical protein
MLPVERATDDWQASPTPLESQSDWLALAISGQLSVASGTPSPSESCARAVGASANAAAQTAIAESVVSQLDLEERSERLGLIDESPVCARVVICGRSY